MHQFIEFVENHLLLWAALLAVLAVVVFDEVRKRTNAAFLTPKQVVDFINREDAVVVDARDQQAFKVSHIIHSINVPFKDFEQHVGKLGKHKDALIVVVAESEHEASKVLDKLKTHGFTKTYVLSGGIVSWQKVALPLVK
jgi:rhodanese-related sulfurtransferase